MCEIQRHVKGHKRGGQHTRHAPASRNTCFSPPARPAEAAHRFARPPPTGRQESARGGAEAPPWVVGGTHGGDCGDCGAHIQRHRAGPRGVLPGQVLGAGGIGGEEGVQARVGVLRRALQAAPSVRQHGGASGRNADGGVGDDANAHVVARDCAKRCLGAICEGAGTVLATQRAHATCQALRRAGGGSGTPAAAASADPLPVLLLSR